MSDERMIKLIWDMRGPEAEKTAEHHRKHLEEVADQKGWEYRTGVDKQSEQFSVAWLAVRESKMTEARDLLVPHRGEVYQGE